MTAGLWDQLHFDDAGLITSVVQNAADGQVLMVAYMNREALEKTIETRRAHYWSRSRQTLWEKGATSGSRQVVREIFVDCDGDCVLLLVDQEGGACHTGRRACFFRQVTNGGVEERRLPAWPGPDILGAVLRVIRTRKQEPRPGSYVAGLFAKGEEAILRKIVEEATEVLLAAQRGQPEAIIAEMADLWFHSLVLLGAHGLDIEAVYEELHRRYGQPPRQE